MAPWNPRWWRRSVFDPQSEPPYIISAQEDGIRGPKGCLQDGYQHNEEPLDIPALQSALLLHAVRQPYELTSSLPIPTIQNSDELLIRVNSIGLNPIDWKAPDYNFGIPTLPYISGRELVGTILTTPTNSLSNTKSSRLRAGDVVIIASTDYRDLRKAAFQQYCIASAFNTIRLPNHITPEQGSIVGVAFVSAVLALGLCMGTSFENVEDGPDLLKILSGFDSNRLPQDIREECLHGIVDAERARDGDFLVIWGGSSTVAHTMIQLARLVGLRILSVVDSGKHGLRLSRHLAVRPDLIVDSHDPARAISIIRAATAGKARFGFDTQGRESAANLMRALDTTENPGVTLPEQPQEYEGVKTRLPTPPSTPVEPARPLTTRSHLVGLTGIPKANIPRNVVLHNVPIKLFHEIPEVGEALSLWCEKLLAKRLLVPPDVVDTVEGLAGINEGLNRMRRREVSGGRLVAILQ